MIISSRAALAGAVLALVFGLLVLGAWWAYSAGYDAGRAKSDAILTAAKLQAETERADALAKLAQVNAQAVKAQAEADRRIAQAQSKTATRLQTVERVIREEPSFSAVVRPDHLGRLRDEQLAELVEAANRGANMRAGGVPTVRPAHVDQ